MKRRTFLAGLGAAAAWPIEGSAQPAMPVIGFLGIATSAQWAGLLAGFREGLSLAGFIEGQNVRVEYRWAENQADRLPVLAADLVARDGRERRNRHRARGEGGDGHCAGCVRH